MKKCLGQKYLVIGCVCVCHCIVVFLTYLNMKPGPGSRVIATGYPLSKTGNAADN